MYYSEIKEFDLKLSGKSGNYQEISFHELARNPALSLKNCPMPKQPKTGVSRKQSMPKFPKNKHFLPPDTNTCVCVSGGKKCLFFGNFGVLCFLETPVLRFALLPYYRRFMTWT